MALNEIFGSQNVYRSNLCPPFNLASCVQIFQEALRVRKITFMKLLGKEILVEENCKGFFIRNRKQIQLM